MRQRTASGLKWTMLSQTSRVGTQLLSVFILARLLPPSDYGLVAMATVVTGFASIFRDLGTTAAIIQKPELNPRLLDSIFWLNVSFGVTLAGLLCLSAPLIAIGFSEPRLKEVLWVLLLSFPIVSLGSVHQALLEKASCFRPLAILESVAAVVGLAGAIWAAMSDWGVYSLVLQSLLTAFLSTAGLWSISRWRPSLQWDLGEIRSVMGFSSNLVGFNMFNYFIRNADNLLIGRFLGASELGYYSMAYRLMLWPIQNISSVVGRVLFPAFSRLQSDHTQLTNAYIRATAAITLITAPLMFGLFVLREPFVAVALGERWMPVAGVVAWLVPIGLLQSICTTSGTLFLATGRTDMMFKWGIGAGLLVVTAFAIGLQWGIIGVAASYAVVTLLIFYPGLAIPFRLIDLKVGKVILNLMPIIATATVMAGVLEVLVYVWPFHTINQLHHLILMVVVGMVTYGGLSMRTQCSLLKDITQAMFNRKS